MSRAVASDGGANDVLEGTIEGTRKESVKK
jgi:hypothetical protein